MPTFNFSGGNASSGGFDMGFWDVSFFFPIMEEGQGFINGPPHTQLAFFLDDNQLWFNGTFSNLDAQNIPQSGTINSIDYVTSWFGAQTTMNVTGLTLPVATMLNYFTNGNVAALHTALFDGNDTMNGGVWGEFLIGYGGIDTINGNGGNDDLIGGIGNDTLNGGDGNDTLDVYGLGEGNDTLNGGAGDDQITANGVDTIDGGDGVDSAYVDLFSSNVGSTMTLSTLLSASGYTFANGTSIRNIEWLQLVSGSGADTLTFDTNGGLTYWNGGLGTDTLIADRSSTNVAILFTAGVIGQAFDRFEGVNMEGVEQYRINGSTVGDQITGREGADIFNGGGGNDTLNGMGGADQLNGGDGNDTIFATIGADTVTGGDGNDAIYTTMGAGNVDGGAGADTLSIDGSNSSSPTSLNWNALGSSGTVLGVTQSNIESYSIFLGSGADTVTITGALTANGSVSGGFGTDSITGNFAGLGVRMFFGGGQNLTVGSFTLTATDFENGTFTGGEDDDSFQGGDSGNWSFNGGGGADTMESRNGNDTLNGGAGDDVIRLISLLGNDSLNGGDGIDTFEGRFVGHNAAISLNSTTLTNGITLSDGTTITNFERLGWANLTAFNDTLDLRGGYATGIYYHGEGGTDLLIVDYSGGPAVVMNYTDDAGTMNAITLTSFERIQITGSSNNDQIMGGSGADVINSGGGADLIYGHGGLDTINAGDGDDTIFTGGAGGGGGAVDGGNGTDTLTISRQTTSTPVAYTIAALTGTDWVTLADGTMVRNIERLSFYGSTGNDTFTLQGTSLVGLYVLHGLGGTDRFVANFTGSTDSIEVDVNAEMLRQGLNQVALASFEQVEITGGSVQDYLEGGSWSNDILNGGGGDDEIWGRAGTNQLLGGSGNDRLISESVDVIDGGDGVDVVFIDRMFGNASFTNVGMSTNTGITLSDGTVIRNVERFQYNGGFNDSTVVISGAILTGVNSIAPGFSFSTYDQATINFANNLNGITSLGGFSDTASAFTLGIAGGWDHITVHGSAHADTLWGYSDDVDQLYGNGGNDTLRGFVGNDLLNGGAGVDTAVYSGATTGASWVRHASGGWTVTSADGQDYVTNVEVLDFTDRDIYLTRAERTFSGDRTSDILFRHDSGVIVTWNVNGAALAGASVLGTAAPSEWTPLTTGDFNGDGRDDIIWMHSSTLVYGWRMNGSVIEAGVAFAGVGTEWNFLGVGDFNWDGVDDFAWQHVSGVVFTWEMSASGIASAGYVTGLGLEWQIQGFGDFNGDNHDDFLWRNSGSGQTYVWNMDSRAIAASGGTSLDAGAGSTIVGIGDFNSDGRDDILWRDANGQIISWQMNGSTVTGTSTYGTMDAAEWQVAGVGDYNGDFRDDVLFLNSNTGLVYVWLLGEGVIASQGAISGVGTEWDIIGD